MTYEQELIQLHKQLDKVLKFDECEGDIWIGCKKLYADVSRALIGPEGEEVMNWATVEIRRQVALETLQGLVTFKVLEEMLPRQDFQEFRLAKDACLDQVPPWLQDLRGADGAWRI